MKNKNLGKTLLLLPFLWSYARAPIAHPLIAQIFIYDADRHLHRLAFFFPAKGNLDGIPSL
jgi:hypothetical protein